MSIKCLEEKASFLIAFLFVAKKIPETKSSLVKQILKELGVIIQLEKQVDISEFREKLANISVWSDDDLKVFEESKKAFENLKPQQ